MNQKEKPETKFEIVFHYMDGQTFHLEIHPSDIENFMTAVGKSEVYYNNERGVGVWVPIDKIRYFQVEKVDRDGNRIVESKTDLPCRDEGDSES